MVLNLLVVQILPAMTAGFFAHLGPDSLPLWAQIHLDPPAIHSETYKTMHVRINFLIPRQFIPPQSTSQGHNETHSNIFAQKTSFLRICDGCFSAAADNSRALSKRDLSFQFQELLARLALNS